MVIGKKTVGTELMFSYDDIALKYDRDIEDRTDRKYILAPSARHYCGDVKDKTVLDLGCGSGFFSRLLKKMGAKTVIGIDSSKQMIELAKQYEKERPLGIKFHAAQAYQAKLLGKFDLVFAGFVLHYASSKNELEKMCQSISSSLKEGGRLVAFNANPFMPLHKGIKYNVSVTIDGDICNGAKVTRTHYEKSKKCFSFDHYHWEHKTYEKLLMNAGFCGVTWSSFIKASDADSNFPLNHWDDYTNEFSIIVLRCTK